MSTALARFRGKMFFQSSFFRYCLTISFAIGFQPPPTLKRSHHSRMQLKLPSSLFSRTAHHRSQLTRLEATTSNNTSISILPQDTSLESLQLRAKEFVDNPDNVATLRLASAIAGGGGHFLSTITSTPGASKFFLEGSLLYDRESFNLYTEEQQQKFGELLRGKKFKFCSEEAAALAALAARKRSLEITAAGRRRNKDGEGLEKWASCIGIACSSELLSTPSYVDISASRHSSVSTTSTTTSSEYSFASTSEHRSTSRAFIDVRRAVDYEDAAVQMQVTLSRTASRTRWEEDVFVAHCVMTCLEFAVAEANAAVGTIATSGLSTESDVQSTLNGDDHKEIHETELGDRIELKRTRYLSQPATDARQVIEDAASRVLSGKAASVMLIPDTTNSTFVALSHTIIPPRCVIFPGSFNPPHRGHLQLAKAAMNSVNATSVFFELSLTNADKPSLEVAMVANRLLNFLSLDMDMPYGILLTDAPLFKQKVALLHPLFVDKNKRNQQSENGNLSDLCFVIGTDTLVRLLDPKYYGGQEETMLQAITEMPCHYCVGGRLVGDRFVTGQENVDALPDSLQSKFTILPDFRVDISSTEIRRQQEQAET